MCEKYPSGSWTDEFNYLLVVAGLVCRLWALSDVWCSLLFAGNLLILYLKFGYMDVAADLLADSIQLTYIYLTPELFEFIDAQIMVQTSPEEVRPLTFVCPFTTSAEAA